MWHIHLLYKLYLYYNYETLKLVIDYPWRWRVLKFQNDKLKTKNSKKMAMIVFHHFFFYETLLLMFTKRTHREITSNALTSNRMSVCNFHYNKRLVRGLRNFFLLLFCFPANDSPILAAVRLINFFSFTCLWNEGFFSGFNGIEGKLFSSSQACFSHHFHVTDIWEPEILL